MFQLKVDFFHRFLNLKTEATDLAKVLVDADYRFVLACVLNFFKNRAKTYFNLRGGA